jgi:hypothetical protein
VSRKRRSRKRRNQSIGANSFLLQPLEGAPLHPIGIVVADPIERQDDQGRLRRILPGRSTRHQEDEQDTEERSARLTT